MRHGCRIAVANPGRESWPRILTAGEPSRGELGSKGKVRIAAPNTDSRPPSMSSTVQSPTPSLPDHVLVVEDDAVLAMSLEMALRDAGVARVEISSTTEMALAALKAAQPDAIVLDVHLADRDDGCAIAELARSLGPSGPRIVFSTGAPQDIPEEIAEIGCVLEKPYDPQDLIRILAEPKRRGLISRLRAALR